MDLPEEVAHFRESIFFGVVRVAAFCWPKDAACCLSPPERRFLRIVGVDGSYRNPHLLLDAGFKVSHRDRHACRSRVEPHEE